MSQRGIAVCLQGAVAVTFPSDISDTSDSS
jgi:hypothetical protein